MKVLMVSDGSEKGHDFYCDSRTSKTWKLRHFSPIAGNDRTKIVLVLSETVLVLVLDRALSSSTSTAGS